jgi:hypothetical protein
MRDVAWGFFYGTVNFDDVLGTTNFYGEVEMFLGAKNEAFLRAGRDVTERFASADLMKAFKAILHDWTNEGFDPFAAPLETAAAFGAKHGSNSAAIERQRVSARRMVGLPGDTGLRTDGAGYPVNRMFADVPQDQPRVEVEPGFESDVAAMPADIRHRGFSTKRSMLLVWENGSPSIPELIRTGKAPVVPVVF